MAIESAIRLPALKAVKGKGMKINRVLAGLWGLAMVAGAVIAISETASARVACDDG